MHFFMYIYLHNKLCDRINMFESVLASLSFAFWTAHVGCTQIIWLVAKAFSYNKMFSSSKLVWLFTSFLCFTLISFISLEDVSLASIKSLITCSLLKCASHKRKKKKKEKRDWYIKIKDASFVQLLYSAIFKQSVYKDPESSIKPSVALLLLC